MSYFDIIPVEIVYKIIDNQIIDGELLDNEIIFDFLRAYPEFSEALLKSYILKYGKQLKEDLLQIINDSNITWDFITSHLSPHDWISATNSLVDRYNSYVYNWRHVLEVNYLHIRLLISQEIYQNKEIDLMRSILFLYKYQRELYNLIVNEKLHIKYGIVIFEYLCVNIMTHNVKNILFNKTLNKDEIMGVLSCEDVKF